jgi:ABC-type nickel/cobalt efflux system permease component RcnA
MLAAIIKGVAAIVLIFVLYHVYRLLEDWRINKQKGK